MYSGVEFDANVQVNAGQSLFFQGMSRKWERDATLEIQMGRFSADSARLVLQGSSWFNASEKNRSEDIGAQGIAIFDSAHSLSHTSYEEYSKHQVSNAGVHAEALLHGLEFLREAGPSFAAWVEAVTRSIYLVDSASIFSASSAQFAGAVLLGVPRAPHNIAEGLVHESAHQYFELIHFVAPPIKAGVEEPEVWSPIRCTMRPLLRVLAAYHALLAILMFYNGLRKANLKCSAGEARSIEECRRHTLKMLRDTEPAIQGGAAALSDVGTLLFEAMRSRSREQLSLADL
jgi:HEXXH motif-containing protein